MALPALPLTPHGKVDMGALPPPAPGDEVRTAFQVPRTDAEELVAGIFAELLPTARVSAATTSSPSVDTRCWRSA